MSSVSLLTASCDCITCRILARADIRPQRAVQHLRIQHPYRLYEISNLRPHPPHCRTSRCRPRDSFWPFVAHFHPLCLVFPHMFRVDLLLRLAYCPRIRSGHFLHCQSAYRRRPRRIGQYRNLRLARPCRMALCRIGRLRLWNRSMLRQPTRRTIFRRSDKEQLLRGSRSNGRYEVASAS